MNEQKSAKIVDANGKTIERETSSEEQHSFEAPNYESEDGFVFDEKVSITMVPSGLFHRILRDKNGLERNELLVLTDQNRFFKVVGDLVPLELPEDESRSLFEAFQRFAQAQQAQQMSNINPEELAKIEKAIKEGKLPF